MHNCNPKIVKILDEHNVVFECKKCGQRWSPKLREGGKIVYGGWQCPDGCKPN